MKVVVMGVGYCGAFPASGGLSYRELIARAASMAYQDAGIRADDLDGAVSVEEDFVSGYSIADEYVPDQLGVQKKAIYTVGGDFLHGLCSAAMQIRTGRYRRLVVEGYSKASNILTKSEVLNFALDPVWNRMNLSPNYLAGLEMQRFLGCCGDLDQVAELVVRAKAAGMRNPLAPFGATLTARDVLDARPLATPVTEAMVARPADGAVCVVLGAENVALPTARKPVYLSGTGWCSDTSVVEHRVAERSRGTEIAAKMAYDEADVADPRGAFDAVYVADLFAHRQIMHLEAMGLSEESPVKVNPDGGALANGDLYEATGGVRFYDAVRQIRGEAGAHQLPGARRAVVQGWRGLPTDSCAVVVVESEGRNA